MDPRLTLEPGHQFTLTTIPTSHQQSVSGATIFHPQHSTQLVSGHSIQLQSAGANIAFASPPQVSHILAPNSGALFQANNVSPTPIHSNQSSAATLIFPSPSTLLSQPQIHQQQQQQQIHSVLQQTSIESSGATTPTQLIHYQHQNVHSLRSLSNLNILPGRPASTPTQQGQFQQQQQTAMLVPIVHTPPVTLALNSNSIPTPTSSDHCDLQLTSIQVTSNPNWVNGAFITTMNSSHLCPVSSSSEDQSEVNMMNTGSSRPSSVLSNSSSSVGAVGSQNMGGLGAVGSDINM